MFHLHITVSLLSWEIIWRNLFAPNTERVTVIERMAVIELNGREEKLFEVERAIECLTPTIRKFNSRERGLNQWGISCEDDVRDLLYVMLRAIVSDIKTEEPVPSRGGTYKFVDLCSNSSRLLIELKWIDRRGDWKKSVEEIHVDTQTYVTHPACDNLFFVLVDNVRDIQDPRLLEEQLSGVQTINGRQVNIQTIVCNP